MDTQQPSKKTGRTEEENTRVTGAAIGGAILGGSLGGLFGALIGGIVGIVLGEKVNDTKRTEDENG